MGKHKLVSDYLGLMASLVSSVSNFCDCIVSVTFTNYSTEELELLAGDHENEELQSERIHPSTTGENGTNN